MPLYTFYPCREDGTSTTFETFELADDEAARQRAGKIAREHESSSYVAIWCESRRVAERRWKVDEILCAPHGRPALPIEQIK